MVADASGLRSIKAHCGEKENQMCVFEFIYFARPDLSLIHIFAYTEPEKAAFLKEIGDKKYTIQRSKGLGENLSLIHI